LKLALKLSCVPDDQALIIALFVALIGAWIKRLGVTGRDGRSAPVQKPRKLTSLAIGAPEHGRGLD
jgi:hypothetical protein